jgi:hypothetical protein
MTEAELKALLIEQWGIFASFVTMTDDQRYQAFIRFDRKLRRAGVSAAGQLPDPRREGRTMTGNDALPVVKRYYIGCDWDHTPEPDEDPAGAWVRYEDYERAVSDGIARPADCPDATWRALAAMAECWHAYFDGGRLLPYEHAGKRADRAEQYASACREALLATEQFLDIALPPEAWARLLAIVRAALAKNPNSAGPTSDAAPSGATEGNEGSPTTLPSGPVGLGPNDEKLTMDVRAAATRFLDEYRKEFYGGTEGPWSDPPDPLDVAYQDLRAALTKFSGPDYVLVPPATLAGDWGKALPICRHCGQPLPEGFDEEDCMENPMPYARAVVELSCRKSCAAPTTSNGQWRFRNDEAVELEQAPRSARHALVPAVQGAGGARGLHQVEARPRRFRGLLQALQGGLGEGAISEAGGQARPDRRRPLLAEGQQACA